MCRATYLLSNNFINNFIFIYTIIYFSFFFIKNNNVTIISYNNIVRGRK